MTPFIGAPLPVMSYGEIADLEIIQTKRIRESGNSTMGAMTTYTGG